MSYVNGVLHGDVLVYSPIDQTVAQRIPFVEGKKKGIGTFYYQGAKTSEISFDNDMMEGDAIFYGPNEIIQSLATYKANQLHGLFSNYDNKKNLIRTVMYQNGIMEGPSKTFYPSGKLLEEVSYKANKIQGSQVQYYEDGSIMRKVLYNEDGKPIHTQSFSPKGQQTEDKAIEPTAQKTLQNS